MVVGRAGAFGLSRPIASLLFGVGSTDLPTVAGVTATMIIVTAVACFQLWVHEWAQVLSRVDRASVRELVGCAPR